jgi:hypothetical protein
MSQACRAAVCLLVQGDSHERFRRCLWSVLDHMPPERVELRLAFSESVQSFHYTLGTLTPDGAWPARDVLPGGTERWNWETNEDIPIWAWHATGKLSHERLARLLYHNVPLEAEYAICLDQGSFVEAGWWDALLPQMEQAIDYIGQPAWHDYLPGEADRIKAQPWYMGVPLARREGRLGVTFMSAAAMAMRAARLRDIEFPGEILLGEMAHQLGWTQAVHDQYLRRE